MKRFSLLLAILFLSFSFIQANDLTQTIRGQVLNKITRTPLPGATIIILDSNFLKGTITDPDGYFILEDVPTGQTEFVYQLGFFPMMQYRIVF